MGIGANHSKGSGHGAAGVASGVRRRPIDLNRKLPLVRSQSKELVLDDETAVQNFTEEDTINTTELQTRLKDIPVPLSVPQERCRGATEFVRPREYSKNLPPSTDENRVDWDIDPAGYAFLIQLNRGDKDYSGPPVDEGVFERVIDTFEKAVKADVLPVLATLETRLAPLVPDPTAIRAAYTWWVERRKQLAMPLVRILRPAPDPDDPDTTGVAFRPREKEGARRTRSNNKKTFTLMAQLRDEFLRLRQLLEHVQHREKLKLEFYRASGDYTEAAHKTLLSRLGRLRQDPRAKWQDDELEESAQPQSHRKAVAPQPAAQPAQPPRNHHKREPDRSHKRRHGLPGRPPKEDPRMGSRHGGSSHGGSGGAPRERVREPTRSHGPSSRSDIGMGRGDAIDEADSEEEACAELLLTVDKSERDALERFLPRHLREALPAEATTDQASQLAAGAAAPSGAPAEAAAATGGDGSTAAPSAAEAATAQAPAAAAPSAAAAATAAAVSAVAAAAAAAPTGAAGCADAGGMLRGPAVGGEALGESSGSLDGAGGRGGRGRGGKLRTFLRVGRGGRLLFDRGGGSCQQYERSGWTPAPASKQRSEALLRHVLATGRVCPPALLERHLDPDEAWRKNAALKIKQGPLLYDFNWLPKPELVPSRSGAPPVAAASSAAAQDAMQTQGGAGAPLASASRATPSGEGGSEPGGSAGDGAGDGTGAASRKRKASELSEEPPALNGGQAQL